MVAKKKDGASNSGETTKKRNKKKKAIQKSRVSRLITEEEEDSKEGSDSLGDIDWEEDIEIDTPCLDEFAPPTRNSQQQESKNKSLDDAAASVMVPVAADPTVSAAVAAVDLLNAAGEAPCEETNDQFFSPEDRVLVRDIVTNEWVGGCVKDVDGEGLEVLVDLDLPGRDLEWVSIDMDRIRPENSSAPASLLTTTSQAECAESVIGSIGSVITGSPSKVLPATPTVELMSTRSSTSLSVPPPKKRKRRGILFGLAKKPPTLTSQASRNRISVAPPVRKRIKTAKGAGYEISKAASRRMPIWKADKSSLPDVKMLKKCKFKEGEKILAKWSDHRMQKFPAVIKRISGAGQYDVLFYDGFEKTILEENIFKCSLEEEEKYRHAKPSEADFLIEEENLNKAERRQKKRKVFDGYLSEKDFKRRKRATDVVPLPAVPITTTPRQRRRKNEVVDTPPPPAHADAAKAEKETGSCSPIVDKMVTDTSTAVGTTVEVPKDPQPEPPTDENLVLDHYPLNIVCHDGVVRKSVVVSDATVPKGWSKHVINWLGTTYSTFLFSPDGYAVHNQAELDKYRYKAGLGFRPSGSSKIKTNKSHQVSAIPSNPPPRQVKPSIFEEETPIKEMTASVKEELPVSLSEKPISEIAGEPSASASDSGTIKGELSPPNSELVMVKSEPLLLGNEDTNASKPSTEEVKTNTLVSTSEAVGNADPKETVLLKSGEEFKINSEEASVSENENSAANDKKSEVTICGTDNASSVGDTFVEEKPSTTSSIVPENKLVINHQEAANSVIEVIKSEKLPDSEGTPSDAALGSPSVNIVAAPAEATGLVNFTAPSLEIIQKLQSEQVKWPMKGCYRKWVNKTLDEKRKASKKIRILPPSRSFPIKRVRTLLPKHRQHASLCKAIDPGKVWSCPKESCGKKFRKENLLQMHIKHYHAELSQGKAGPKVVDLAVARSVDSLYSSPLVPSKAPSYPSQHRLSVLNDGNTEDKNVSSPRKNTQQHEESEMIPLVQPEERKPTIKTLLPRPASKSTPAKKSVTVNKSLPPNKSSPTSQSVPTSKSAPAVVNVSPVNVNPTVGTTIKSESAPSPSIEPENEIQAEPKHHGRDIGKEVGSILMKVGPYRRKHHHFHRHRYQHHDKHASTSSVESSEFLVGESSPRPEVTDEGVVIERLKSEEIINCICGSREEDGLMVQCEICLCWQHGICTGIERDSDVPDRYVCRTCRNPMRVRSSHKFHYARQYLTQAKLPRFSHRTCKEDVLKQREQWLARSFELSASLRQLQRIESSLSTKINIAQETDHPKLYMWSTNWEENNADQVSDAAIRGIPGMNGGKDIAIPGGAGPVGEAPIESEDCRLRLLDHIEHYQLQMDTRLSYLQTHIANLESEDSDFANEESCSDHHPLLKQAVYMLMRDLATLRTAITLS